MITSHAKSTVFEFLRGLYISFIPNRRDNLKQLAIKILFLVSLLTLIVSASYLAGYFLTGSKQKDIIEDSRKVWFAPSVPKADKFDTLLAENSDFKGWITIPNTLVNNPVYQTTDDAFYLDHNQLKEKSRYGALFFSAEDDLSANSNDQNLVLYGHNMKDGTMFGTLKRYKNLSFYKQNPTFTFSTKGAESTYKIFAVILLNARPEHDNNYIFNVTRSSFTGEDDFNTWMEQVLQRSILETKVDVKDSDSLLTLITCSSDIEDGRLVIMARKSRVFENKTVDTANASVNPHIRYPKVWYDKRGLAFPYDK